MIKYAGIGPRVISDTTRLNMITIGSKLATLGRILRSGGAPGSDDAFEKGCIWENGRKEIYLPWNGFEGRFYNSSSGYYGINYDLKSKLDELVNTFYPRRKISQGIEKMMMRNCHQVMGYYLNSPIKFIITNAVDLKLDSLGKIKDCKGGTGMAVRLSYYLGIPIYSLSVPEHFDLLEKILNIKLIKE